MKMQVRWVCRGRLCIESSELVVGVIAGCGVSITE